MEIKGRSRRSQVKIEQVYSEVTGQETAVSSNWTCMGLKFCTVGCTGEKALKQSTHIDYIAVYRAPQRFFCDWSSIYTGQCLIGGAQGSPALLARWVQKWLAWWGNEKGGSVSLWRQCIIRAGVCVFQGLLNVGQYLLDWCVCVSRPTDHTLMCVCCKVLTVRIWCVQCKVVYVNRINWEVWLCGSNTLYNDASWAWKSDVPWRQQ